MAYKIIPLTSDPDQTFTITLPVDGKNINLTFRFRYNTEARYWCMSITNATTGINLIDSVPLVTGEYPAGNLLEQYSYLQIGSSLIVKLGNIPNDRPDETNLGTEFIIAWGDTNVS